MTLLLKSIRETWAALIKVPIFCWVGYIWNSQFYFGHCNKNRSGQIKVYLEDLEEQNVRGLEIKLTEEKGVFITEYQN